MPELSWASPKGKFAGAGKQVSEALGRKPFSTDLKERHPFDVEILRVPPGKAPYVYHSHSAQWEFYHVISGRGIVRHKDGTTPVEAGDAFIFPPDEPHQVTNDGSGALRRRRQSHRRVVVLSRQQEMDSAIAGAHDHPLGESGLFRRRGVNRAGNWERFLSLPAFLFS